MEFHQDEKVSYCSFERLFLHVHLILSCCGRQPTGYPFRPFDNFSFLCVLCVGGWGAHPRGPAKHLLGPASANQTSDV